jgi:hypothetical protein
MRIAILCMLLLALAGCSSTPVLNTNGKVAGTLPDGRTITRFEVFDNYHTHYIYVVENATSLTTNRSSQTGKTTTNSVESVIQERLR